MTDTPPPLKAEQLPKTVDKVTVREGDSVLILRENGEVDIYCQVKAGKELNIASLTALSLYLCLENEEWRIKTCKKMKSRVEDIIAGRSEL